MTLCTRNITKKTKQQTSYLDKEGNIARLAARCTREHKSLFLHKMLKNGIRHRTCLARLHICLVVEVSHALQGDDVLATVKFMRSQSIIRCSCEKGWRLPFITANCIPGRALLKALAASASAAAAGAETGYLLPAAFHWPQVPPQPPEWHRTGKQGQGACHRTTAPPRLTKRQPKQARCVECTFEPFR